MSNISRYIQYISVETFQIIDPIMKSTQQLAVL